MAIRQTKDLINAAIKYIHETSQGWAGELWGKRHEIGFFETIFIISLVSIVCCFALCLFVVTSICSVIFLIGCVSYILFVSVSFFSFHMICISICNLLKALAELATSDDIPNVTSGVKSQATSDVALQIKKLTNPAPSFYHERNFY